MRYHVLAADYDGTLAHHGRIDDDTWAAIRRFRDTGRKVVMVTGRELDELLALLAHPELFDRIVAENGALVYTPATKEIRVACTPPPPEFARELTRRGAERVAVGRCIVATWEPHQDTALHVIHDLGLELQVIFNKGAVMVLPSGVNKATGLAAALADLGFSRHNVVGIGDAENDHALLEHCECGVAVSNALPVLKARADLVTEGDHGRGVAQLMDRVIADDLADLAPTLVRHHVPLGKSGDQTIAIDPYSSNVLVCGTSGSGKSTLTTGILERLSALGYQFAILDPEGDYTTLDFAVVLGAPSHAPLVTEVLDVVRKPAENIVVNMLGVAVEHRPEFFAQLLPSLLDLRTRTGRPHWLVIDEAHHMLPRDWTSIADMPIRPRGTIYVTVHPESVAPNVLATIDTLLAIGDHPVKALNDLCDLLKVKVRPRVAVEDRLPPGQALFWRVGTDEAMVIKTERPKTERTRHSRKYIEGNLGKARSFYFRGPNGKLNLKAKNLHVFMDLADGVDDETWKFHLGRCDYANWLRTEIKDDELAAEVEAIAHDEAMTPESSRAAVRAAIEKRYTLPADKPSGIIDDESPI
jgi:hydroxymethylpyrimidine pyrophosphatase-like HAD family hydrolase